MTTNFATYTERINEAWNSHETESVLGFYSPAYVGNDVGQPTLQQGHPGLRQILQTYWGAFPDLTFEVTEKVIEGSRLAIVWVAEGTHQGPIMNIPPTGHRIRVTGMSLINVEDGLVVWGQHIWDMAGMLRHLGLLPDLQTTVRSEAR